MSRAEVRNVVLAMVALTLFVVAMIASYAGAFAKPTLHHMAVAVAGPEQQHTTLALRTVTLAGYSALLAGGVTLYVDTILGALTGHGWQVFGALWLYAMAVGGAVTGIAAAFGTIGRPLLSGFYSTFTEIVPQGSGVALLRGVQYLGGNGAQIPLFTLAIWGAAGCVLAVVATVVRSGLPKFGHRPPRPAPLNYRADHDRYLDPAGRDRAVLRPGLLSPAD